MQRGLVPIPRSRRAARRHIQRLIRVFALVGLLGGAALAQGPGHALAYRDPGLDEARAAVAEARAELERSRLGLSAGLDVDGSLEVEGEIDDPESAPAFATDLQVGVEVGYLYDPPEILADSVALLSAQAELRGVARRGVEDALLAHVGLLRARLALQAAEGRLAAARQDLAAAEQGESPATSLERARLELDRRRFALERAARDLREADERAVDHGFVNGVEFARLSFVLPEPDPETHHAYRRLRLELRRAEAEALEQSVFAVVEEVRLEADYLGPDFEFGGSLSVDGGRPGAGVGVEYDPGGSQGWAVSLSGELHFDDRTLAEAAEAEREVAAARAALEAFPPELARELREAREAVEAAARELDFSMAGLALDQRRLRELEAEAARLGRVTGEAAAELASVRRDRDASQDAVYRDWMAYVGAVADYLEVVDGDWEIR